MTIKSIQKVIKVGDSRGVTIPAKELKRLKVNLGDEVEVTIKKPKEDLHDAEVMQAARSILERYHSDFKNLANR